MTALSATVGTGNTAGVATAIALGGPGAIFYVWLIALFGIATKYANAVYAVRCREVDKIVKCVGGPCIIFAMVPGSSRQDSVSGWILRSRCSVRLQRSALVMPSKSTRWQQCLVRAFRYQVR